MSIVNSYNSSKFLLLGLILVGVLFIYHNVQAKIIDKLVLHEVYEDDFLIGTALGSEDIKHYYKYPMRQDKAELKIVNREFNCITAENLMKPQYICPHPGKYYFDAVDEVMNFADKNNHVVVGHVWYGML